LAISAGIFADNICVFRNIDKRYIFDADSDVLLNRADITSRFLVSDLSLEKRSGHHDRYFECIQNGKAKVAPHIHLRQNDITLLARKTYNLLPNQISALCLRLPELI